MSQIYIFPNHLLILEAHFARHLCKLKSFNFHLIYIIFVPPLHSTYSYTSFTCLKQAFVSYLG
jgi:hypothetical protein